MTYNFKKIFFVCLICLSLMLTGVIGNEAYADNYQTDRFSEKVPEKNFLLDVLDSPKYAVRMLKKTLKHSVLWIETYHILPKVSYYYKKITDTGLYPVITDIGDRHGRPEGVDFAYGVYGLKNRGASSPVALQYREIYDSPFPSLASKFMVTGWMEKGFNRYRSFGFRKKVYNVFGSEYYAKSTLHYNDSPREDYFGEGPNLSIGNAYSFSVEELSYSFAVGREFLSGITLESGIVFSSVDIEDAKDNDKGEMPSVIGVNGADMVGIGISLEHDNRDRDLDPKRGGFKRFKLDYFEGIDGDDYGYWKGSFDFAHFIPVGEYLDFLYWDSALGLRLGGEVVKGLNGDKVPFFGLSRLGGSETLRGYQYNRFTDNNSLFSSVEYRYNIWGARQYKLDAALFCDAGWIFDDYSEIEIEKIKAGYGASLRLILPNMTISLTGARSDEGTEWYIKAKPIF